MSVFDPGDSASLRRQWKKLLIGSVLVVLLSATAVASAILLEVKDDIHIIQEGSKPIRGVEDVLSSVSAGDPQTVLLLGSDKRLADAGEFDARSDTIILVHLDPDKGATAVMSIPRDLQVEIPGHGMGKINEAYTLGGPTLSIKTIEQLLSIDIHHVININFGGFERAVNRLGCVYAEVDRRYFNDNTQPGPNYATINLKPGYQKLCGSDALDFVRFRHQDSDFIRAARQQEFLRQAKAQIGAGKLFSDRKELLRIFGHYTQTDIAQKNTAEILGLIKLVYESSKSPITEIRFPATDCPVGTCVEISPTALQETVDRFISVRRVDPGGGGTAKKPRHIRSSSGLAPGLVDDLQEGEQRLLPIDRKLRRLGLPVYFPAARLARGGYATDGSPRSYAIRDRAKTIQRAYRIVLFSGDNGEYYGVQGTTWKNAPILADPTDTVSVHKRTYRRYFDGSRLRLVAWQTPKAVYWVTNTLSQRLTNKQMMGIAESLQEVDRRAGATRRVRRSPSLAGSR